MAQLFKNKTLKAELKDYQVPDFDKKMAIVKSWHEAYKNGSLKKKTETQCEQTFNQSFFVEILGYTAFPSETYTIDPKGSTETGGQKPDAILGYFSGDKKRVTAVVEIKDVNTPLDKSQQREGNLSPIQQAFKYKPQFKDCSFVIATNFFELRLLKDNQLDFERFTLEELVNEKDDYFSFKKFYYLLNAGNFIRKSGKSQTESILAGIRIEEEQITKKFYSEYKGLRKELIKNITENLGNQASLKFPLIVEKAQKIIDRIVFICFCEDLGLLPENKLIEVIEYGQKSPLPPPIWDTMKQFFFAIDSGSQKLGIPNGYNGELFKTDTEINAFKIDDAICRKFANFGKYDFAEDLSVNILGHIFEQSISDIEELKRVETAEEMDQALSKRKKDGIFYTPDYIVDYIVKNTLGAYLQEREKAILEKHGLKENIEEKNYQKRAIKAYDEYQEFLHNVKVLDPACGSGAFLVKVFDYLLAENKRVAGIISELQGIQTTMYASEAVIKGLLQNNIYGVDLNQESVEITKLSLWLKTAHKGEKLATLKDNIKCGNSLIDDVAVAGAKAFSWKKEFADIFKNGGFDVIIGNPPYVPTEMMSETEKEYYKKNFPQIERKYDTSILFILNSLSLIHERGKLGFISSITWQTGENYGKLREYLFTRKGIDQIVNLPFDIFSDAYVDTCIYVLSNKSQSSYKIFNFGKKESTNALSNLSFKIVSVSSVKPPDFKVIIDIQTDTLLEKIKKRVTCCTVGEITISTQGLSASRFERGEKDLVGTFAFLEEGQAYRYRLEIGKTTFVSLEDKPSLKQFYEAKPKILIRRIISRQDRLLAAYTDQKMVFSKDINPFVIASSEFDPKYLLALINSKLMSWLYVNRSSIATKDDFRQTTLAELRSLPIAVAESRKQHEIGEKAGMIIQKNAELRGKTKRYLAVLAQEYGLEKIGKKLEEFYELSFDEFIGAMKIKNLLLERKSELFDFFNKNKSELQKLKNEIDVLDSELDQEVFDLYKLTPEEREVVLSATNT